MSKSISSSILSPIIKTMMARYPKVRIWVEPEILRSKPHYPQLENREVDLLITRLNASELEKTPRTVKVEVILNDRIRLAVDKNCVLARRRKIKLAELAQERWIAVPSDDIGGAVLVDAFRAEGLEPPSINVTTYSVHLRNSLASGDNFIAALPESVLFFNKKYLRELPVDLPEPLWPIVIATRNGGSTNAIVERFVVCAREIAASTIARFDRSNQL